MSRPPRALVLVWLCTLLVFGPALRGDYVDDDLDLLLASPALAGIEHLLDAVRAPFWGYDLSYWRPLTSAIMCLGHGVGGGHPWPTHLVALIAHLAAIGLAFAILRRLGAGATPAALAAGLLALHPCQVESVAWVAALGDPLSGAASLLALFGWVRWRERGGGGAPALACLGLGLALAAKESGLMALGWLGAADLALRRRWPVATSRWLRGWLCLGAVVALWLGLRALVFGDLRAGFDRGQLDIGRHGGDGVALRAWLGSSFLAVPTGWLGITPYRWVPPSGAELWADLPLRALAPLGLLVGSLLAARRLPQLAALGGLGCAAALAPAVLAPASLGPWPLVDRYLYLALFGMAAVTLGCGATRTWVALLLLFVCGVASAIALPHWRDHRAVLMRAVADCSQHPEPHFMAGNEARLAAERVPPGRDRAGAVTEHCRAAVAAYARARTRLQRPVYAADHLRRVLGANLELGTALANLQGNLRPPAAVATDLAALALRFPHDVNVELARGIAAASAGDPRAAESAWLRALELAPDSDQAAFNLGKLYADLGDRTAARARFEQALALRPGNAAARAWLEQLGR